MLIIERLLRPEFFLLVSLSLYFYSLKNLRSVSLRIKCVLLKEEGRAANKSPHEKFGYFLFMSQQAVSANIIPNSAVGIFSQDRRNKDISSLGILISWLPHKFRRLEILGPLRNFKIQQ
jgi:hypothetical protein